MANNSPVPSAPAFLDKAQNTVINGGQFIAVTGTVNNIHNTKDGFTLLQEHVAPAAFHDSAQRVDPPRCHQNTREAVLQELYNWIIQDKTKRTAWIAWLSGAAGAGKSAICQSIAEMCIAHAIIVASFFFFRTDPSRCTIDPLVATLAYQLIRHVPEAKDLICHAIECNPLIFQQSFETQLSELVVQPLRQLQLTRTMLKLLLIIDGVDECTGHEHQTNIIRALAKFVAMESSPIIVLFGSRAENQLQAVFRSRAVAGTLLPLPLDNHYLPDNDIRLFLVDKFSEIKETHPLSHLLSAGWPAPERVEEIVTKSSGQFIYASVVINFISLPYAYPGAQLDIIRGLRPSGLATPFSQLDALYRHIFSTVRDLQTTTTLLAFIILLHAPALNAIENFFNFPAEEVISAFSDLAPVVAWDDSESGNRLRFLHASLPDFLLDEVRSQEYYINIAVWSTHFAIMSFEALQHPEAPPEPIFFATILEVLNTAEGTPDLRTSAMTFDPSTVPVVFHDWVYDFFLDYLGLVKGIEFGDGDKVYHHQLNIITRYFAENDPPMVEALSRQNDISQIRAEIELERMKKLLTGTEEAKKVSNQSFHGAKHKAENVLFNAFKWFKRGAEKLFK